MRFNVGYATDIGRRRQQNQDSGVALPELGLFVVADGMGGHRGGETASAMAVEIIPTLVRERQSLAGWGAKETLAHAIRQASNAIHERSLRQPQLQGMGTTTTALLFKDKTLAVGHVGDSRCYYFRPDAVWQVTRDHSLVQEKLRAGLITRDQLKTDRMRNVITRSVGFERDVNVETYEITVQPGDTYMLCSDGLSGLIDDPVMLKIIQEKLFTGARNIQETATELVRQANDSGGDDNITVLLVQLL